MTLDLFLQAFMRMYMDMFCTVLIGSAAVKTVAGQLVTPRGYRNV